MPGLSTGGGFQAPGKKKKPGAPTSANTRGGIGGGQAAHNQSVNEGVAAGGQALGSGQPPRSMPSTGGPPQTGGTNQAMGGGGFQGGPQPQGGGPGGFTPQASTPFQFQDPGGGNVNLENPGLDYQGEDVGVDPTDLSQFDKQLADQQAGLDEYKEGAGAAFQANTLAQAQGKEGALNAAEVGAAKSGRDPGLAREQIQEQHRRTQASTGAQLALAREEGTRQRQNDMLSTILGQQQGQQFNQGLNMQGQQFNQNMGLQSFNASNQANQGYMGLGLGAAQLGAQNQQNAFNNQLAGWQANQGQQNTAFNQQLGLYQQFGNPQQQGGGRGGPFGGSPFGMPGGGGGRSGGRGLGGVGVGRA